MKTVTEVNETSEAVTERDGTVYYYTKVISRQDWADVPANGIYAGKSYKITQYFSSTTEGYRHIMLRSSSEPWTE